MIFSSIKFNTKILGFISTTFAYSLMHNIFSFYYVKIFLNYYHVSASWFQISQVVFMIWNAVNDPLFGYFQDNSKWKIFRNRRYSILYGAPFYGLSFLVAWFPFGNYENSTPPWVIGIHLISALCFYDTMFTFVLLAHSSIFAEMNLDYKNRLNLKWWSIIASLCAGISVPLANHNSDSLACLGWFRLTCIGIAAVATCCMIFTGLSAKTVYEEIESKEEITEQESFWKITKEILSEKDFHGFVWLNFFHQGHSVYQSNFASIFIDFLVPGLSPQFLNVYYGILWTLPQLLIIVTRGFIESIGYYRIIRAVGFIKIVLSATVWLSGQWSYVFLGYLLIDCILVQSVINLYDIALADIVDNDRFRFGRKRPMSSMIFGSNALITKPAQSLFPMLIVFILSSYGYQEIIKDMRFLNKSDLTDMKISKVIFNVACGVPFFVGIIQSIFWSFYSIRTSHQYIVNNPDVI